MTEADEAELSRMLRAALAGDERAYRVFLARVAALVRGVTRRNAGGMEIEDIVQETLLAIHLKRHTWRTDAPVRPWVFAIARYKLIDALRRRGRRMEVDIADYADRLAEPEAERGAGSAEIQRALSRLPEGQRRVVSAVSVDGLSIAETALKLSMNEGAVRVALHRGLKAIAREAGD